VPVQLPQCDTITTVKRAFIAESTDAIDADSRVRPALTPDALRY